VFSVGTTLPANLAAHGISPYHDTPHTCANKPNPHVSHNNKITQK